MPGGPREAYEAVRPIFEAIAAQADGAPCVAYLGAGSCGHYVKMVHNGIEYGLMQLISESLRPAQAGAGARQRPASPRRSPSGRRASWNRIWWRSPPRSSGARDDRPAGSLVDLILGEAAQKGTGMWTSQNAMDLHVPVPNIDVAVSMRNLSGLLEQRTAARETAARARRGGGAGAAAGAGAAPGRRRAAPRAHRCRPSARRSTPATILTYIQGFAQLQQASAAQGYDLALRDVASIWRGGCIIRSALLRRHHGGLRAAARSAQPAARRRAEPAR